jgi:branched-subunit amino acid transport protein
VIWLAIVGSAVATYLTRALPLIVTVRGAMPAAVARYLDALPIAIIAALAGSGIAAPGGLPTAGAEPIAALVVAGVVLWWRNLLLGVVAGVVSVAALRAAGLS